MDGPALLRRALERAPLEVVPAGDPHSCVGGAHSRLADRRLVCWRPAAVPGAAFAVDAELADQPVPPALAARLAADAPAQFWARWTAAEVCAKLLDLPIITWVTQQPWPVESPVLLGGDAVHLEVRHESGLVLAAGVRVRALLPGTGG